MSIQRMATFDEKKKEIIYRLNREGVKVSIGKKTPINGQYSGIIGLEKKVLRLNIKY